MISRKSCSITRFDLDLFSRLIINGAIDSSKVLADHCLDVPHVSKALNLDFVREVQLFQLPHQMLGPLAEPPIDAEVGCQEMKLQSSSLEPFFARHLG